jgi:hypothetical protein
MFIRPLAMYDICGRLRSNFIDRRLSPSTEFTLRKTEGLRAGWALRNIIIEWAIKSRRSSQLNPNFARGQLS